MDNALITPEYVHTGILVVTLCTLLGGAYCVVSIWDKVRRKPTIEQTLLSDYISREEYKHSIGEIRDDIARIESDLKTQRSYTAKITREIFDELRKINASLNKELQGMNRSLGEIEGKLESILK